MELLILFQVGWKYFAYLGNFIQMGQIFVFNYFFYMTFFMDVITVDEAGITHHESPP